MANRSTIVLWVWMAVAAGAAVGGGLLQEPLDSASREYELVPPQNIVAERHPELAILNIAPGGLRSWIINYLWIRADKLKEKGRIFDAMQLGDLICRMEPNFDGVWSFQAWNMAWNISVMTHTPEERWLWVNNGIRLLRDEGIPVNPKSLLLYKDLSWIFFQKMGQSLDEMHMVYKQRWASQMQRVLTPPVYAKTEEVIDAFKPIAAAPLDKDLRRQGREVFQADQREALLRDAETARYAALLEARGVRIDETLLDAYNRYSRDPAADAIRQEIPKPATPQQEAVSALINSAEFAAARTKALAFVRAQILWNVYKMDPEWMLGLMTKYNAPLDWRQVNAHGLYWATYGIHVCNSVKLTDMDAMNTDRQVMYCMKELTWGGKVTYLEPRGVREELPYIRIIPQDTSWQVETPRDPLFDPMKPPRTYKEKTSVLRVGFYFDWRFIEPCHQEHVFEVRNNAEQKKIPIQQSQFVVGHVSFLSDAICMLYAGYKRTEAQKYYDYLRDTYHYRGGEWDNALVQDWIRASLWKEGKPVYVMASTQIGVSLQVGFYFLAVGDDEAYDSCMKYAQQVYEVYRKGTPARNLLEEMYLIEKDIVTELLIQPQMRGYDLSLLQRARLYSKLDHRLQLMVYDMIAAFLPDQCAAWNVDFKKAFPVPIGIEQFRAEQRLPAPPQE